MEQGEGAETTTTTEDPVPDKNKVKIRCGMFFDGTLNNRTNIEKRLIAVSEDKTTTKKLTEEELAVLEDVQARHASENDILEAMVLYDEHKSTKLNDDNSYEAFFSNVVKLERHLDTKVPNPKGAAYQYKVKVYVEGSGSIDKGKDDTKGFAFAKGAAGIEKKVDSGLERALKQIKRVHFEKEDPIELLTLDVFGFSRGAAAARYFIHRALYDYDGAKYRAYQETLKNSPDGINFGMVQEALMCLQALKAALQADDYTVGEVKICFAGLFDTVSSFGYTLALNSNNTEDLKLDAVKEAEETVHLASADEHRTFFSLTDTTSAGGKGREVYLPGVHSDIGGGYRDDGHEEQVIYFGLKKNTEADRQRLIKAGWYTLEETELEVMGHQHENRLDLIDNNPNPEHSHRKPRLLAQLRVNRPGIRSQYNRIPLHLMTGYAKKRDIAFEAKLERVEVVPDTLGEAQEKIQAYVSQHDALGARTSKAEDWHDNPEDWHDNQHDWLRKLRGRYFHFSAHYSSPTVVGHIPRIEGGVRIREKHRG